MRAYTGFVDVFSEAERISADVNRGLADKSDDARIRYVSVEPDSAVDDGWLVLTFWELPFPVGEIWPERKLRRYRDLLRARFDGVARTMCVFRDPDEIKNAELRTGWAVRELA